MPLQGSIPLRIAKCLSHEGSLYIATNGKSRDAGRKGRTLCCLGEIGVTARRSKGSGDFTHRLQGFCRAVLKAASRDVCRAADPAAARVRDVRANPSRPSVLVARQAQCRCRVPQLPAGGSLGPGPGPGRWVNAQRPLLDIPIVATGQRPCQPTPRRRFPERGLGPTLKRAVGHLN